MLEHFCIFTKSGIVLWDYSYEFSQLRGNPVNDLIKAVLLEERSSQESFSSGNYAVKWVQDNQQGLVFVAVWEKQLTSKMPYVEELINAVKGAYQPSKNFDSKFQELYTQAQTIKRPRSQANTSKPAVEEPQIVEKPKAEVKAEPNPRVEEASQQSDTPEAIPMMFPGIGRPRGPKVDKPKPEKLKPEPAKKPAPKPKRPGWHSQDEDPEDFIGEKPEEVKAYSAEELVALGVGEKIDLENFGAEKDAESDSDSDEQPKKSSGGILQFLKNIANKELTEKDLEPVLAQCKSHLISKNVAQEIAENLCNSVKASLVGKQLSSFTRVSSAVKSAMEEALTRILTPKRNIDILRDARNAKQQGRPYSIVFVGVNGVGKSTTLSKVCSWLRQNGLSVLIAACDTFRAGAVEQLAVHAKNLSVPLHHKGYGKNAAAIAKEAISRAAKENIDVVLIDTAGRMQDNEPLMVSLAKLVGLNEPDLVLFVGEALVGNDSVDQLTKFNRALEEYSTKKNPRYIDGIILSKFDTVDDKVGAAISMVYTTGQPIVFVGVGQKYSDLRVLNVSRIVSILLKGS